MPIPNSGRRKVTIINKPEKAPVVETEPIIPPPKQPEIVNTQNNNGAYEYYYPKEKAPQPPKVSRKSKRKAFLFGSIVIILIAAFVVSMMTVFASATIVVTPKSQEIDIDSKITAVTNQTEPGLVKYEVIKLSESKTMVVPATGEEAVELKASGKIVVYNNFSTEPQRLIVRTRFETPEGLIFRIPESIVVPGKTIKNGVESPGSVEVEVFADEAGDKYNIDKSDFTIPGFKTDANRYKNFYARSATEMTGGFVGKRKTVVPAEKQTALQKVETELKASLTKNLESKVPEGLVMLPDSILYKSKELTQKEEASGVVLGKEVTAYALMLSKKDLSDNLTDEYLSKTAEWDGIKPIIKNYSALHISNLPGSLETGEKIDLQIKGKAKMLADINADVIGQKLLGASKGDVAKLIDEFAGISSITSTVRPIWKQSLPQNPSKIYVKVGE